MAGCGCKATIADATRSIPVEQRISCLIKNYHVGPWATVVDAFNQQQQTECTGWIQITSTQNPWSVQQHGRSIAKRFWRSNFVSRTTFDSGGGNLHSSGRSAIQYNSNAKHIIGTREVLRWHRQYGTTAGHITWFGACRLAQHSSPATETAKAKKLCSGKCKCGYIKQVAERVESHRLHSWQCYGPIGFGAPSILQ